MPDFAGGTSTELERKLGPFRVVCIVETISYLALLTVWLGLHSSIGTELIGSAHGMIFTAFSLMVLGLRKPLGWSWVVVSVLIGLGPVGAVIAYAMARDGSRTILA